MRHDLKTAPDGPHTVEDAGLEALAAPELAPMFRAVLRLTPPSPFFAHVPFTHWLVAATRPGTIVELGVHTGASYGAFCQAVLDEALPTRCYGVDPWRTASGAGPCGDELYRDLLREHQSSFPSSSHLIRCELDEAVPAFANGSIDILHLNAVSTYEALTHAFETWAPKLSHRAVLLVHGTHQRGAEFGAWRFWADVSRRWPSFEFPHGHGLGIACPGIESPPRVLALCTAPQRTAVLLRKRFAFLGRRWEAEAAYASAYAADWAQDGLHAAVAEAAEARYQAETREAETRSQAEELRTALNTAEASLAEATARADALDGALREMQARHAEVQGRLSAVEASTSWRVTVPLRGARTGSRQVVGALARGDLAFRIRRRLKLRRLARHLCHSPHWDAGWYRRQAPELADPGLDPLRHYLLGGSAVGLAPNPLFDPSWYAAQVRGLALADALGHYLERGIGAGLQPHPLFDPAWYVSQIPAAGADPLAHYLAHGAENAISPHPLFDADWYRRKHLGSATVNPLIHYIEHRGAADPNPLFMTGWYVGQNPEAAQAPTPLEHYLRHPERNPNPAFDTAWYLRQEGVTGNPLADYLHRGVAAGLAPFPGFDPEYYQRTNPGSAEEGPLAHYLRVGKHRPVNAAQQEREDRIQAESLGLDLSLPHLRVCVGIVTYNNTEAQLRRAIGSAQLAACRTGCSLSVLLVDNGDPSSAAVRDMVLTEPLMPAGNVGFGVAQNRLMAQAFADAADVFIALNPDAAMHPDCLASMLRAHVAANGRALVQPLQFPDEHPVTYDRLDFEIAWASGACLLIPRRIYEAIGGFDERFFMYCEDVDYSWRARAAGFRVKACPPALLFHTLGGRVPDRQTQRRFLSAALYLARKWNGPGFEQIIRDEMARQGLPVPEMPGVVPGTAPPGIADFEHEFLFAPPRWS